MAISTHDVKIKTIPEDKLLKVKSAITKQQSSIGPESKMDVQGNHNNGMNSPITASPKHKQKGKKLVEHRVDIHNTLLFHSTHY